MTAAAAGSTAMGRWPEPGWVHHHTTPTCFQPC